MSKFNIREASASSLVMCIHCARPRLAWDLSTSVNHLLSAVIHSAMNSGLAGSGTQQRKVTASQSVTHLQDSSTTFRPATPTDGRKHTACLPSFLCVYAVPTSPVYYTWLLYHFVHRFSTVLPLDVHMKFHIHIHTHRCLYVCLLNISSAKHSWFLLVV